MDTHQPEENCPRDCHRRPSPARAAYLTHLHTLGYPLADIEQHIIDAAAPAVTVEPEADEPDVLEPADQTAGLPDDVQQSEDIEQPDGSEPSDETTEQAEPKPAEQAEPKPAAAPPTGVADTVA